MMTTITTGSIKERLAALEVTLKSQESDRKSLMEIEQRIAALTEVQTITRLLSDIRRDISIATQKRDLSQRVIMLEQQCTAIESDFLASKEESRKLSESLDEVSREFRAADENYKKCYATTTASREALRSVTRVKELLTQYLPQISDAEKEHQIAEAFTLLIDPKKGVGPLLLEECRQALVEEINASLMETEASFKVFIEEDFSMNLVDNVTGIHVPSTAASGYQAFVLGIVSSKALARLSRAPVPNIFMIDEGFGTLDDTNVPLIGELVTRLPSLLGNGVTVIAVTHRDDMKNLFRSHLTISRHNGVSKVSWMMNNAGVAAVSQFLEIPPAAVVTTAAAAAVPLRRQLLTSTMLASVPSSYVRRDVSPSRSVASTAASRATGSSTTKRVSLASPREWEIAAMAQGMLRDYTCQRCGGGSCFPSQTVWKRHASSQKHTRNGG